MNDNVEAAASAHFLGIARLVRRGNDPFPIGVVDILGLTQNSTSFIYPAKLGNWTWLIIISKEFLGGHDGPDWSLQIVDDSGHKYYSGSYTPSKEELSVANDFLFMPLHFVALLEEPKRCSLGHCCRRFTTLGDERRL